VTRRYIYFAGPITDLTYDEANDWRAKWTHEYRELGLTALSPLRGKEHLRDKGVLAGVFDEGDAAVERDCFDIRRSEIVLANFEDAERVSIGTCMEIAYAWSIGRHVVTVLPGATAASFAGLGINTSRAANPHDHIFVTHMSSVVVPSMDAAFAWIANLL
jgi:nucleoside 2-deoxyribosyltransferase